MIASWGWGKDLTPHVNVVVPLPSLLPSLFTSPVYFPSEKDFSTTCGILPGGLFVSEMHRIPRDFQRLQHIFLPAALLVAPPNSRRIFLPRGKNCLRILESGNNPILGSPRLPECLRRSWPSIASRQSTMLGAQRRPTHRHGGPNRPPNLRTKAPRDIKSVEAEMSAGKSGGVAQTFANGTNLVAPPTFTGGRAGEGGG
jgi:hypothetical protein